MHVLFIHQAFPAQFGRLGLELTNRHGWRCSFLMEAIADCPTPSPEMLRLPLYPLTLPPEIKAPGGSLAQSYEKYLLWSQLVLEAIRAQPELRPDLVVAYGPLGPPSLFLPEVLSCPVVNYCDYYYGQRRDVSYRIDLPPVPATDLWPRCINAINLVSLTSCAGGYAPTHWQRQTYPERFHKKIEVHFDGVDTELYRPRTGPRLLAGQPIPLGTRVVTFVTRGLESMRGFDPFMKMAGRILRERSDVLFVVVGNDKGYYGRDPAHTGTKSFKEWVLRQGEYDLSRFVFFPHIHPDRLAEILNLSDLHVYLTVPFVPGWSLFNALSTGCVVLAADIEPVREIIAPGVNGLLAPLLDVDALAEAALRVLADPAAYRPLGEAGRRLMEEKYSVDVAAPELRDYFERMAATTSV